MSRTCLVALAAATFALAACAPAAPADGPGATVAQALARIQAKDLDGLRALACEGQEGAIRDQLEQLGVPLAAGAELLPGLDVDALREAIELDVSDLEIGEPAIDGEVAQVPVTGDLEVTFDAVAMKPILQPVLEAQGRSMTDDELDAMLTTLEAYGQSIPVEQTIRLVRDDGTWKVCQSELDGTR